MVKDNRIISIPTRVGKYLLQPSGYRTFIPSLLLSNPPVQLAGELQKLLSRADRALDPPAHKLNGFVYHGNWLYNLLISASMGAIASDHRIRQNQQQPV